MVFEAIPIPTYTLSITASGNGSVSYSGTSAKNNTKTFTVNEGTSVAIAFTPDSGYRIKSVKVNSTDVTSKVSNNSYTISSISSDITIEVDFEAIPIPTYTLSIKATGNGSATYDGTTAKNNTKTFTQNEGTSATIAFAPDNGYRIKSVKVNSVDVTSSVSNNSYTVNNIRANTTVEVEFEAIPINSYTLKYVVDGVTYQTYQIQEGATITPEAMPTKEGYTFSGWSEIPQIMPSMDVTVTGSFTVNKYRLTYQVDGVEYKSYNVEYGATITPEAFPTKDGYTFSGWSEIPKTMPAYDVTIIGTFIMNKPEVKTYTLSINTVGNGTASYNGMKIVNNTQTFTFDEGSNATIMFSADDGYQIKSVTVNGIDVTTSISNNQYTFSNISSNNTIEVEFEAVPSPIVESFEIDGINYKVGEGNNVSVISGESANYIGNIVVPSQVTYNGTAYTVTSIGKDAFHHGSAITSVAIPSTVTSIGESAFGACTSLTSITIPNSVTEIAPAAFYGCSALKNIILPSGLKIVDENLFWGCSSLTSVTIPESVTTIGEEAFRECMALPSITIPNSVTEIGERAFENCTCLKEVISEIEEPSDIPENVFQNIASDAVLQVPQGTKTNYQQYDGWTNHFAKVKEEGELDSFQLTLSATGSGSISYNDISVEGGTQTISIEAGASATVTFHPNDGYRIKSATMNGREIADLSSMSFTIDIMDEDVTIEVEFEAIPVKTYILTYVVDGETYKTYEIDEGATITPEVEPIKEGYSFSGWNEIPTAMPDHDVTVTGTFTKMESQMTVDGISYEVVSFGIHTVVVADGDYGQTLEVPATVNNGNDTWTVMGLKDGALDQCENLAAIIWDPSAVFNARVSNPNLLLYVKDKAYASFGVNNVIVNGTAESIELTDAASGNDFYCPKAFTAKKITYSHYYNMKTGLGESKGWETIVLPFDVQKYTSPKGEIVPFAKWTKSGSTTPFWLCELTASGYQEVDGIKANTPYIISMPNHEQYLSDYVITGLVTFSAEDVEVKASDNMQSAKYQDRTFVPNYTNKAGDDCLALNVNNYYVTNPSTEIDGSKFIKGLRAVHPFEAYMTTTSNTRSIDVMDGMTTAIKENMMISEGTNIIKVYDTRGVLVKICKTNDDLRKGLAAGVYIVNGKKMIIK